MREVYEHHDVRLYEAVGRDKSKNNEIFRKWGVKERTNEEMRADYFVRARDAVEGHLGLKPPAL